MRQNAVNCDIPTRPNPAPHRSDYVLRQAGPILSLPFLGLTFAGAAGKIILRTVRMEELLWIARTFRIWSPKGYAKSRK